MEKLHPKAILFDLGSTLIEYEAIPWPELDVKCVESGYRFLAGKNFDLPEATVFAELFDDTRAGYRREATEALVEWDVPSMVGRLLDKLSLPHDEALVASFFEAYYAPVAKVLYAYDDVPATLAALKAAYPTIGLISNTVFPAATHLEELNRFGIKEYFSFMVFSSDFKLRKPHPDIFYHGANLAGYAPSECLYIGDRFVEDVEGPAGVGMDAILKIKPGREYPSDMPDTLRKIDHLSELLDHLEH